MLKPSSLPPRARKAALREDVVELSDDDLLADDVLDPVDAIDPLLPVLSLSAPRKGLASLLLDRIEEHLRTPSPRRRELTLTGTWTGSVPRVMPVPPPYLPSYFASYSPQAVSPAGARADRAASSGRRTKASSSAHRSGLEVRRRVVLPWPALGLLVGIAAGMMIDGLRAGGAHDLAETVVAFVNPSEDPALRYGAIPPFAAAVTASPPRPNHASAPSPILGAATPRATSRPSSALENAVDPMASTSSDRHRATHAVIDTAPKMHPKVGAHATPSRPRPHGLPTRPGTADSDATVAQAAEALARRQLEHSL